MRVERERKRESRMWGMNEGMGGDKVCGSREALEGWISRRTVEAEQALALLDVGNSNGRLLFRGKRGMKQKNTILSEISLGNGCNKNVR